MGSNIMAKVKDRLQWDLDYSFFIHFWSSTDEVVGVDPTRRADQSLWEYKTYTLRKCPPSPWKQAKSWMEVSIKHKPTFSQLLSSNGPNWLDSNSHLCGTMCRLTPIIPARTPTDLDLSYRPWCWWLVIKLTITNIYLFEWSHVCGVRPNAQL